MPPTYIKTHKSMILTSVAELATSNPLVYSWKESRMGMKLANIRGDSTVFLLKASRILFEPSVYNGTGDEARKGIVFAISEEDAKGLQRYEEVIREMAGVDPKIWNSSVRFNEKSQVSFKCKINVSGPNMCRIGDVDNVPTGIPEGGLRGRPASMAIQVKAVYQQRQSAGLVFDVITMRYGAPEKREEMVVAFDDLK